MINSNCKIAIVVSEFNPEITENLFDGALSTLLKAGIDRERIKVVKVPGAVEIPLIAKMLALTKEYSAIICLGAVIRGDTDHYTYVCQQVSQGCQQVMMEFTIPVIFGVLTTKNLKQAMKRVSHSEGHKGVEVADAAIAMVELMCGLKSRLSQ